MGNVILVLLFATKNNFDRHLKKSMIIFYANVYMLMRRKSKCSLPVKFYMFKTYGSDLYCALLG